MTAGSDRIPGGPSGIGSRRHWHVGRPPGGPSEPRKEPLMHSVTNLPQGPSSSSNPRVEPVRRLNMITRHSLLSLTMRTISALGIGCLVLPGMGQSQSYISGWGDQVFDSRWNDEVFVEVAAGGYHTVARRSDGSVVAWGLGDVCTVPALPAGLTFVEVAAGRSHMVARRSDGSVVAWGDNYLGQCNVLALPAGLAYVEVAAGW